MRSIRRPPTDDPKKETAAADAPVSQGRQAQGDRCESGESQASLWLGDFILALGCFAAVTAAGQLPFTAPRLLQAISSARIAAAAKRSTTLREMKIENMDTKSHGDEAAEPKAFCQK